MLSQHLFVGFKKFSFVFHSIEFHHFLFLSLWCSRLITPWEASKRISNLDSNFPVISTEQASLVFMHPAAWPWPCRALLLFRLRVAGPIPRLPRVLGEGLLWRQPRGSTEGLFTLISSRKCCHSHLSSSPPPQGISLFDCPGLSWGLWDLRCNMWDLVPWPGIEPRFPALEAWRPSRWTVKEVPSFTYL